MSQRRFDLVPGSVLAALVRHVEPAVAAWCADWDVQRASVAVECARAWEVAPSAPAPWRRAWALGEQAVTFEVGHGWHDAVAQLLYQSAPGAGAGAPVAAAGAEQASLDLGSALAALLLGEGVAQSVVPARAPRPYACGAVRLTVQVGPHFFVCQLEAPSLTHLRVAPVRLAPLAPFDLLGACADLPVRLPVHIGNAEVQLASLLSLAPGDVIRFDSLVDDALAVRDGAGAVAFYANLGARAGRMALEVTCSTTPNLGKAS